jgi:hypothetical protein
MTASPDAPTAASAVGDPIRIVPLHVPSELLKPVDAVAEVSAPKLTYRGGPLLTAVKVFTVYWGAGWNTAPLSDLATKIDGFFDFVLTSALMDQMAEYSAPGWTIGHGKHIGRIVLSNPPPKPVVSDAAIRSLLQKELDNPASGFPAADANTLYFFYLPPGVAVVQGGARSCQAFCGYHNDIGRKIFYAVMPYPGCQGCTGGLSPFDALTSTSSHELCEAITDPVPGDGWYDDVHGEIGDICAWKTRKLGDYTVQLEWSNKQNKCI